MRIALVSQHYAPHFEGGTEVVVRAQARALAARGHDLRVVSGTDRAHAGVDVERARVDGIPVAHLPRVAGEGYDLVLERARLAALVAREVEGAELVHVHHWSTLRLELVRALATRGRPVVVTLHDLFTTCARFFRIPPQAGLVCPPRGERAACVRCLAPDAPGVSADELERGLVARAAALDAELEAAAALLVPSRAQRARLAPLLGLAPERLAILPHGLCAALVPAGSARAPLAGRALVVLHFGNRCEAKGTLDLVRALAALPAGSAELVCAGAEVEAGFDARLAAAAGALPLSLRGPFGPAELAALAARADVAAFPSRAAESYGLVLDEALALGLPACVSDRGALRERVGRAGWVLPAEDPSAWTRAFAALLAEPARLERARSALPTTLRTAADAAAELEALYAGLVARAR